MSEEGSARTAVLDPDPFGGDPPSRRQRWFGTRESSPAARNAGFVGGISLVVLGGKLHHHFWGVMAVAAILWALPWFFERRARERRRRERETLLPAQLRAEHPSYSK